VKDKLTNLKIPELSRIKLLYKMNVVPLRLIMATYSFTTEHDPQVLTTHLAMHAGSDPESDWSNWVHAYACSLIMSGTHTAVLITPVATLPLGLLLP
jgi:hypothetical protein